MTKKKRKKKVVVSYIYEGKTEKIFLEYLSNIYNSEAKPLTIFSGSGGSADSILLKTLKVLDRGNYLFVILDEDFKRKAPISEGTLRSLERAWCLPPMRLKEVPYRELNSCNYKNRKPVVIFSNPSSIEGIFLQILGVPKDELEGKETSRLKDQLNGFCKSGFNESFLEMKFTKILIEKSRKNIPELDLLISLLEKAKRD